MKKRNLFLLLLAILTVLPLAGCKKSPVAVEIDNEKITVDDFERYYYTQLRFGLNVDSRQDVDKMANDPSMMNIIPPKNLFMDQLIAQKVLYKKAMSDKSLNKKELDTLIELATMQMVSNYYLMTKLKGDLEVSDAEVEQVYNANKAYFKGAPINARTIFEIKQKIKMDKFQAKAGERSRVLIDEAKVIRDGFTEYMKEEAKKQGSEAILPPMQIPNQPAQQAVPQK